MNSKNMRSPINPVLYAFRKLLGKLLQHPEIYPTKYYKKGNRYRRNWKSTMVK